MIEIKAKERPSGRIRAWEANGRVDPRRVGVRAFREEVRPSECAEGAPKCQTGHFWSWTYAEALEQLLPELGLAVPGIQFIPGKPELAVRAHGHLVAALDL